MLYRRYLEGETVEELAAGLGIPLDRVQQRIRVAALLHQREQAAGRIVSFRREAEQVK
jgi:DNA-directed RNA polymerase specialized sigma24 family protein